MSSNNNSKTKLKPNVASCKKKPGISKMATVWITKPRQNKFEDNYVKLKQIGEAGSFGKAFQVKRKKDGKILAVKEISKGKIYRLHASDKMRQSLLKSMEAEIDIMSRLNHRYIVNMEETYETKHTLHIVMEECKGGELFDRIKKRGRYSEIDARPIIKMVCKALFYMHEKHRVVHCDLKPDNILFVSDDEKSDIKIIDFGMSKVLPRLRSLRQLCGTPYYTAPEIINGEYSHACDMWSVGVIAYVMIFGFPPFYVDPNKYYGIKETKEIYKLILKGFDPTVKKGYGAYFPKSLSSRLSKNGMDFIAGLLSKDIGKRLTAKEALQHPWLKSDNNDNNMASNIKNNNKLNVALDATPFANFCISHKFKYAISTLFRDQYKNMRPKHFENLKNLFISLDTDGNGKISYAEFEQGMLLLQFGANANFTKEKIKQMFRSLDYGNSGEIVFDNLLDAFVHDYLIESDVRLYEAFRDLDEHETGKIQLDMLKKKIYEMNIYDDDNIQHILAVIDDVDLNNDGTIDYEEFLRALHPDFNNTPNWFWKNTTIIKHHDEESKSSDEMDMSVEMDDEEIKSNNSELEYNQYIKEIEKQQKEEKLNNNYKKKNGNDIVKQGWMSKEGKVIKSWKRRYFKLTNSGKMGYYHNQHEKYAIATFNVKKLTCIKNKSWSKNNNKRYGIKVYTPHRNWKFLCRNNNERAEWIKAIETVAKQQSNNQQTNTIKPIRSK